MDSIHKKRHRLRDWLHKQDPTFCCMQETHLRDKNYLRVKGWETDFQANSLKNQAGVDILISSKININTNLLLHLSDLNVKS
jgi:exonuclease III